MNPHVKSFVPHRASSNNDNIPSFLSDTFEPKKVQRALDRSSKSFRQQRRVLKLPYVPKKRVNTTKRHNILDEDKP